MAQTKRLFRVYFYYPKTGQVVFIADTVAVSKEEAKNHVRYKIFGKLPVYKLMQDKGIKILGVTAGFTRDNYLSVLAAGRNPAEIKIKPKKPIIPVGQTRRRPAEKQLVFSGPGFNATEPTKKHWRHL